MSTSKFKAEFGSPKVIGKLVTSDDHADRAAVAKKHPEYHEKLSNDEHPYVREQVAYHTKNKAILDKLSDDHDHDVSVAVASHGHKDLLDKLVTHPNYRVRLATINGGSYPDLTRKLVNDPHEDVRDEVARSGEHSDRDHLVHDESRQVRMTTASYGNESHHRVLMHDQSWSVRRRVATHAQTPDILHHLANDRDPSVREEATQSLHKMGRFAR